VRVISKKGITIRAVVEHHPEILEYAKRFQDHFKPTNIYNIQCTLDDQGGVYPFEVNPRISTTFCLAVSTGFDPFALASLDGGVFVPTRSFALSRHWKNLIE
jgi:carbamoyl-phosphate synthase large subunit